MKKLVPALAIVFCWTSVVWPASQAPLTTLRAVHALTNDAAATALPVAFPATVTYFNPGIMNLIVQDDGAAIYVYATTDARLAPGDRVMVRGTTRASFRPVVVSNDVTLISHGVLPVPIPASFAEMLRGEQDCMRVAVHAVVRAANLVFIGRQRVIDLQLLMDGGYIEALVDGSDPHAIKDLLDADVEVTGDMAGKFDGKKQLIGIALYVSSPSDVTVLHRAGVNLDSLPVTPMDRILAGYQVRDLTQRIRVKGTITYYQPGAAAVLQSGDKSLWIDTQNDQSMLIGDLADASGFPDVTGRFMTLTRGEIRDTGVHAPIPPQQVDWGDLSSGRREFDLVSIEGQVLMAVREAAQDEYVMVSGGQLFSAIYHHPDRAIQSQLPPMKQVAIGSRIRVTGICMLYSADPFHGPMAFDLLLRSPDDVTIVAKPSWLNVRNLMLLVSLLVLTVFAVGFREWLIERKVRRHASVLAYIERRRGRILEDINGSRPLAEIIEKITELVSFRLQGAPCWCQVADGAQLGNRPPNLDQFRVVQQEINARKGPPLGVIYAGFDPNTKPDSDESEALSMAVGLATLAIETRRLYSDLLHRSEFDLLTDIHNRFALEEHLDDLIAEARSTAGIFGLIYIDLDEFKKVNDLYGHQTGDQLLQEVVVRMKHQLRSCDMLARIGGDEFAVLVPEVHNRAGAEEIAQRLAHSFDEPFAVEGYLIRSSASVGVALYPEDATKRDRLLSCADAAMYVNKKSKGHPGEVPAASQSH
ncbi:MAG: GGDEF domain-containing protein [Terracidiphilus sp.]|jgi:diguanylate cyclase (GGDEF)-like protein